MKFNSVSDKPADNAFSKKPPSTRFQHRVELGQDFTPATPSQMERLEAAEKERIKHDDWYITEEKAREIPQEVLDARPDIRSKIEYSQVDWPAGKASATKALGPLPGGEGQETDTRRVTFEQLTKGDVGGS